MIDIDRQIDLFIRQISRMVDKDIDVDISVYIMYAM